MITNKNYLFPLCSSLILALFLSACGGGSSGSSEDLVDEEAADDSSDVIETDVVAEEEVEDIQGLDLIKAYANGETDIVPALNDYIDAGVFGLSIRALDELNEEVMNSTPEEVDTVPELDLLVASLFTTDPIPQLSEATINSYLAAINNARAVARNCGEFGDSPAADPVTWNNQLYNAAYEHSQDLAETSAAGRLDTFSHDGSNTVYDWTGYPNNIGSSLAQRINAYGYAWSRASENISAGTIRDTAQEAVDSWIDSDGHCDNLMDPNMTEVGMALYINEDSKFTHYWTQDFGAPRS